MVLRVILIYFFLYKIGPTLKKSTQNYRKRQNCKKNIQKVDVNGHRNIWSHKKKKRKEEEVIYGVWFCIENI